MKVCVISHLLLCRSCVTSYGTSVTIANKRLNKREKGLWQRDGWKTSWELSPISIFSLFRSVHLLS